MAGEPSSSVFSVVMRGYDRVQVDDHIRGLEAALKETRNRVESLDNRAMRLTADVAQAQKALREAERPSYAGLGARIEQLLRLAEEQAGDIVTGATQQANALTAEATSSAADITAKAQAEASRLVAEATAQAQGTIAAARLQAESVNKEATEKAALLTSVTEREVSDLKASATRETQELLAQAHKDAEAQRSEAASHYEATLAQATELKAVTQREIEQQHAEAAEYHEAKKAEANAQARTIFAEAETRADEAEARLKQAMEQAETSRVEAEEHARTLVTNARKSADQVIAEARAHADKVISEAKGEAERNRRVAQKQVDELNRQRDAITAHLDQLRSLLGTRSVPGLEQFAEAADAEPETQAAPVTVAARTTTAATAGVVSSKSVPEDVTQETVAALPFAPIETAAEVPPASDHNDTLTDDAFAPPKPLSGFEPPATHGSPLRSQVAETNDEPDVDADATTTMSIIREK